MRTITLHGALGKQFGESYRLDVKSPAEAVRALCILLKGFKTFLLESEKNNLGFKVYDADNLLAADDLTLFGSNEIKIVPVIGGANAEGRILAGVVLIAVGAIMSYTGVGAAFAPYAYNAGFALILGGAIELMVGKPKVPQVNGSESPQNKASYLFNGPVNTTAQGHAVPVGYGRMIVGSAVISASITNHILNAGYVWKVRYLTAQVVALGSDDKYVTPPPKDWTARDLISSGLSPWFGGDIMRWIWQFTYPDYYLELLAV